MVMLMIPTVRYTVNSYANIILFIFHNSLYFTGTGDALKLMAELLRIFIAGTCKLKIICVLHYEKLPFCVYCMKQPKVIA